MTQAAAQRQQGDNGSENYGTTRSGSCGGIGRTLGARHSCAYKFIILQNKLFGLRVIFHFKCPIESF